MCGADIDNTNSELYQEGLPSRVRSRHIHARIIAACGGITFACAEQTTRRVIPRRTRGDYLRVCGADVHDLLDLGLDGGLPSRVRSRRTQGSEAPVRFGITFACAEQTVVFYCVLSQLNGVEYLIYALRRVS